MFGLVDCNNFFASCERVFNPSLRNRPVVILSNNDGCIIARSNEAKALGIRMGMPYYQARPLLEENQVAVYSSNYTLYGDMSRRVMMLLSEFTANLMVYSIDEAFLDMDGMGDGGSLAEYGHKIVNTVTRGTGIPVTLGVAPTKTLAKMASHFGKKYPAYDGVCLIDTDEKRYKALKLCPIGDVWGIGRRLGPELERVGVHTAWDFIQKSEAWVRRVCAVTGVRTWKELQGYSCISRDDLPQKKSICTSRSFSDEGLAERDALEEALANFAASCSEKLRRQHSCCTGVTVFAYTSRFRSDMPQHTIYENVVLQVPTNDQQELIHVVLSLLRQAWINADYHYKKAGVIVWNITADEAVQTALFDNVDRAKQAALAKAVEKIKRKNGRNAVRVAVQGADRCSHLKREHLSCRFTTDIDEIIRVKV